MIVVLDTNVLVFGLIQPSGPPGRIVDFLRSGALHLAVDDRILAEYGDVLRRRELARYFRASDAEHILEYIRGNSEQVLASLVISDLPDPMDAPFIEVALACGAPLVTGNLKHFPVKHRRGCVVMPPAEFIRAM